VEGTFKQEELTAQARLRKSLHETLVGQMEHCQTTSSKTPFDRMTANIFIRIPRSTASWWESLGAIGWGVHKASSFDLKDLDLFPSSYAHANQTASRPAIRRHACVHFLWRPAMSNFLSPTDHGCNVRQILLQSQANHLV
jgi:hypothetical protein